MGADLPAHRSAAYITNSLWPFLMSVSSQSIWASSILNIANTKLLRDFTMSLAYPSFWGSNSLLSALGKEWDCWKKLCKQLMWGISALIPLFWALLHLKQSIYCLSAAHAAKFLSLSLKKTPTLNCTTNHYTSPQGIVNATLLIPYFFNNPTASARNNDVNTSISALSIMIKAMPVTIKVTIW